MTIVESIKCVLQQNNDGLTSKQIYDEIIRQGLYSFGAENPVGVVNAQLRRRCIGLDFPTAYPIKFFEIAGYEGKKIKFRLISTENTATIITAPKTTDISELLPEEKIKAALQEHLQNIRQQVFDSVLNNSPEFFLFRPWNMAQSSRRFLSGTATNIIPTMPMMKKLIWRTLRQEKLTAC